MEKMRLGSFYVGLCNKNRHFPFTGQLELTYRCSLDCIHCYCKGSEDKELTTQGWKKVIDIIQKEGCLWITFTGGEPLIRDDFLEIYSYAKTKGFIITLFSNAQLFTEEVTDYLVKMPPDCIEITLNGITEDTYEAITQTKGAFSQALKNIEILKTKRLPFILKTNCLKQNKKEVVKIKAFANNLLGKPKGKYPFKYDTIIYPRLNGDKTPCQYRLSLQELLEIKSQDSDIWKEYQFSLHGGFPDLERDKNFLYHCDTWLNLFFINPYGQLRFCPFSDKFSVDLKTTPFKNGFYKLFPQLLKERFKTNSKCRDCSLRPICSNCPARAYLETGDEEAPVEYFCEIAQAIKREIHDG